LLRIFGQPEEAIKSYRPAVDLNRLQLKPSPWPLVDLAVTLIGVNRLEDAKKTLDEALRYDARPSAGPIPTWTCPEMQGNFDAALEALTKAAELDHGYPEPHLALGQDLSPPRETARGPTAKSHGFKSTEERLTKPHRKRQFPLALINLDSGPSLQAPENTSANLPNIGRWALFGVCLVGKSYELDSGSNLDRPRRTYAAGPSAKNHCYTSRYVIDKAKLEPWLLTLAAG